MDEPKAQNEAQEGEALERRRRAERQRHLKIERYRYRTLWMIMLGCSGIFLGGIWLADIDMETLVEPQERYKAAESICIRTGWITAGGDGNQVKACTEWVRLSDPSGRIHRLQNAQLVKRPDGSYEVQYEERINFKLLAMIGFVVLIGVVGHRLHASLIERYRLKIG